jgi:RNA polymerase sigma factor (sigma-70 family)
LRLFTINKATHEETLIRKCIERDASAQRRIYDMYSGKMMGVCRRYLYNIEEAEEALSNGFIKIFTHMDRYEFKGSFEGWIRKIMVRECLMYLRGKKSYVEYTDNMERHDSEVAFDTEMQLDAEELLILVDELPEGYRAVFNLYAIEGYKHHEIAEMLEITESTSKTQLMRARRMLQSRIVALEKSFGELSNHSKT